MDGPIAAPVFLGGGRGSRRGDVRAAVSREDHASARQGPRRRRPPRGPRADRADRRRHRAPERGAGLDPPAGPGGRRADGQGHHGLARRRPQGPERPAPRAARGFPGPEARGRGAHPQGPLHARVRREAAAAPWRPGPAAGAGGRRGPDLSRMALDVKVGAADNVWIANRMAKIETAVALDDRRQARRARRARGDQRRSRARRSTSRGSSGSRAARCASCRRRMSRCSTCRPRPRSARPRSSS